MFKKVLSASLALALGGALALIGASAAQAHTGDLSAAAVCQTDGTYKVTYTLTITKTDLSGVTNWKAGNSNFEGTPTSNAGLAGAIASTGAGPIVLGTTTVPGTSTSAPWAYAFTSWTDEFTKGSDGGNIELAGTCKAPDPKDASYKLNVGAPTCAVAGTASVTELTNAKLVGTVDTTPGTHTVTVDAIPGHQFSDGTTEQKPSYTVLSQVTGLTCYPPVACTTAGGFTITPTGFSDEGDRAPKVTPAGFEFKGPGTVDVYQRVTAGNLQGLGTISYTIAAGETGQPAQVVVEINPHSAWNTGGAVSSFGTISTNLPAGASGTTVVSALSGASAWSSTRITYGQPGSLFSPQPLSWFMSQYPANTLLSAPSLHLLSGSTSADDSTVTAISSNCGSTSFVPAMLPPKITHTTSAGEPVCSTNGGGTVTTTYTYYEQDATWSVDTKSYVYGTAYVIPTPEGQPSTTVAEVSTEVCPAVVTPVSPTITVVPCGVAPTTVLPGTVTEGGSETANASYSLVVASDKASATVTATPKAGFKFATSDAYTLVEGSAQWALPLVTTACAPVPPVVPPVTTALLAHTGATVPAWMIVVMILGALSAVYLLTRKVIQVVRTGRHSA